MTSHVVHRFSERDMCAGGCGRVRAADTIYCAECRNAEEVKSPFVERDLDVHIELMEERFQGGTKWKDRLEEKGTHCCKLCGHPALPGRIYCSPRCRGAAPRVGGAKIKLDGIKASFLEHARRLGIADRTALLRVSRGMNPIEALRRPKRKWTHGIGELVFVVDGIEATYLEHATRIGIGHSTVLMRVERGMDPIEALKKPVHPPGIGKTVLVVNGVEATLNEHMRRLKLSRRTVRSRIERGMDPVEALQRPVKKSKKKKS